MEPTSMYFDYAAATPVHPKVMAAMLPYFTEKFGNPSTIHSKGVEARTAVEAARGEVARLLNAHADEIVFTSGATEAVNLAILGVARAYREHGNHIISSAAEHKSTLETLKAEGFDVTLLPVDKEGRVSLHDVMAALRPDTILISVIFVNNEVGSVNPIFEIGRAILKYRKVLGESLPLYHVDIAQAIPYLYVDVEKYKIDLASFSGGKIGAPKGVGALYVRRGVEVDPLHFGGGQEKNLRPGTENVPGIVGLGMASTIARQKREVAHRKTSDWREAFISELSRLIPDAKVNGSPKEFAPHIINISIPGIDAEELILRLDARGVYVSAASACTNSDTRSHVLRAMGYTPEEIHSSIRFSLGREVKKTELMQAVQILSEIVQELRKGK